MNNIKIWLLPVLSGILLGFSWPETGGITPFIFIGLVPLLFMEEQLKSKGSRKLKLNVFGGAYLAFLIFNLITTWWIKYASFAGMIMAEVFNSLFMAGIFLLFHITKNKLGNKPAYIVLVIYWLAFEWLHYNWELSWVWLTFGNVFANQWKWVQWYEYTGVLGGSFWVMTVNVWLFSMLMRFSRKEMSRSRTITESIGIVLLVFLPIIYSISIYNNYEETENPVEIVVIQPNIDPYNEKFGGMSESDQIDILYELAIQHTGPKTDFVICPETAFPVGYWEHALNQTYGVDRMMGFLQQNPHVRLVTGLSTMRLYGPGEKVSSTARQFNDGTENHYDYYNTAMQLNVDGNIQLYHKSKLVLGVEKMPFGSLLKPLESLSINLGGASGSLGYEEEALNFHQVKPGNAAQLVAPVICYESVYGEYLIEYVKKGAELVFIITNDGWWENTAGYRQHLAYARLRAIETRRSIARSANTGISAFIDQRGDVFQPTQWWKKLAIRGELNASQKMTFYTNNGDYIGRVAAFFAVLLVVLVMVKSLSKKNEQLI